MKPGMQLTQVSLNVQKLQVGEALLVQSSDKNKAYHAARSIGRRVEVLKTTKGTYRVERVL